MGLQTDRRYLLILAAAVAGLGGAVIAVNRGANPYSQFATDWIPAKSKPETFTHLRMVKAAQVRHLRPQGLILGSSRAETGLDPGHPSWKAQPVYNLGLSNAGIYEIKRYFEHACHVAEAKQAVLLLDYSAFLAGSDLAPDFREERLAGPSRNGDWWQDTAVSLASWDALAGTAATLAGTQGEKTYLPDGSRDGKVEDARVLAKGGAVKAFAAYEARVIRAGTPVLPSLGPDKLELLREVLRLARAQEIDLRLAIAPMHARYFEILHLQGQWGLYEDWKRALVRLVEEEAAASGKPAFLLADFSGYNSFTTEAIPQRGLAQYFYEASHFTKKLGNELLTRLLGPSETDAVIEPGGFGFVLTSANLDTHLDAIRKEGVKYRLTNQADLQSLKPLAGPQ